MLAWLTGVSSGNRYDVSLVPNCVVLLWKQLSDCQNAKVFRLPIHFYWCSRIVHVKKQIAKPGILGIGTPLPDTRMNQMDICDGMECAFSSRRVSEMRPMTYMRIRTPGYLLLRWNGLLLLRLRQNTGYRARSDSPSRRQAAGCKRPPARKQINLGSPSRWHGDPGRSRGVAGSW